MSENMELKLLTEGLAKAVGTDCGLACVVKFDFGDVGVVVIDATVVPNRVHNEDGPADCTLIQSAEDFVLMNEGALSSEVAFLDGRLRVEGDMSIAMRLDDALKN